MTNRIARHGVQEDIFALESREHSDLQLQKINKAFHAQEKSTSFGVQPPTEARRPEGAQRKEGLS